MAGQVRVGDGDAARTDLKAATSSRTTPRLTVAGGPRWVSRGAHKLIAALDAFGIDVAGTVGGRRRRVDRRLHRRAARARRRARLRRSTSATGSSPSGSATTSGSCRWSGSTRGPSSRDDAARAGGPRRRRRVVHLAAASCSGPIRSVLRDGRGPIVALVKPQFEAGRAEAKGGVVRDPAVHRAGDPRDRGRRARRARARDAGGHRVADPGARGQPRVPRPPAGGPVVRGDRTSGSTRPSRPPGRPAPRRRS